jgi:phenylpropionate dioxygenase-like ring-hydroxylating dioxygenase large terminal subunit
LIQIVFISIVSFLSFLSEEKAVLSQQEHASLNAILSKAKTLPPRAYTSPAIFDRELETIFRKEWVCVAREDQIPGAGDYKSVEVVDQPLIVVRLKDNTVHAMSSICPHRAMQVVNDSGNTRSFSCPYHLWKFGLDGGLISAPHMDNVEDFPPPNCGLKSVKVEIWEGFIFVNLDPESQPLRQRLGKLDEEISEYRMADLVVVASSEFDCPWNWKILVENFMEAYHHIGPHLESIQPSHNAKDSYVSGSVSNGWSVLHMPEVEGFQQDETGQLPMIEGITEKQQSEILASLIMPTFAWLNSPSVAFWYELKPSAYNKMKLVIHTLLPGEIARSADGADIATLVQSTIEHIHLEDIAVNEGPWKGLNAPLTEQGPLSHLEEAIWQMNQWWSQRIQG